MPPGYVRGTVTLIIRLESFLLFCCKNANDAQSIGMLNSRNSHHHLSHHLLLTGPSGYRGVDILDDFVFSVDLKYRCSLEEEGEGDEIKDMCSPPTYRNQGKYNRPRKLEFYDSAGKKFATLFYMMYANAVSAVVKIKLIKLKVGEVGILMFLELLRLARPLQEMKTIKVCSSARTCLKQHKYLLMNASLCPDL